MMGGMLFFLMASVSAFAQDRDKAQKKTPEEKARMMTEKMKDKLSLTDEQYSKVEAANLDFVTKKFALKQEGDKTGADDKIKSLQDEYNSSMREILNEEQYRKFTEMDSKMKDKSKQKS